MVELERMQFTSVDARVARAAIPGYPLVTRHALREAGVSRAAIARRRADGRMTQLWGDVMLLGPVPSELPRELLLRAAVAAGGPGSALDGESALERRGMWSRGDGAIHVASVHSKRPIDRPRIYFHRHRDLDPRDDIDVGGIPTRPPLDALFAAARALTPHQLAHVIKAGTYLHAFATSDVENACRERGSHPWIRHVARALELREEGSAGTKSRSEDELLPLLTAAYGEPKVNVFGIAGPLDYEPDFCWAARRRIVEVDGGHHREDPLQAAKDHDRDLLLTAAGWSIVRIPHLDVWRDPVGVMSRIDAAFTRDGR